MEAAMGSKTSVHVGCLLQEYSQISQRDSEMPGNYQIVGSSGLSMLANRLSWFYDFTGPSMTVDTACSGSLLALHLACQDLLAGSVDMALACGSNLSLVPDSTALLSALNMMSPDSTCYSFDERANGYSRSEGFGVVVLKRLSQAITDGDMIRGIIRSTGCNQDGRTPGITQPSQAAQERLTRETYQRAGLDLNDTHYFEAHGTGTTLGDPTEAGAISNVFTARTAEDPIYVGALKSNIGHPEAASGIAAVIKTVLVLEEGVIPPNLYPERINPAIASTCPNLKFPLTPTIWPTNGVRRASVNSFGYGGTNVHVVIDDSLSFLSSRNLSARHGTKPSRGHKGSDWKDDKHLAEQRLYERINGTDQTVSLLSELGASPYKLLMLSAFDERAVQRSVLAHEEWLGSRTVSQNDLADLAYTLSLKRSSFPWKSFCIASLDSLSKLSWSSPARNKQPAHVCFVFTGQGAQWYGMGRELYRFDAFRRSITKADRYIKALGSEWSIIDELYNKSVEESAIQLPELSQPICTAVQVAIVDLLSSWKVRPSVAIGHSSGEIAAAYVHGAISHESAWMIAYFRGLAVAITRDLVQSAGAMVAVLATPERFGPLLDQHNIAHPHDKVNIACYNSSSNHTVSGSRNAVDRLTLALADSKITFRLLKIDVAYHSQHMNPTSMVYGKLLRTIEPGHQYDDQTDFISTVTGKPLEDACALRTSEYWMRNLTAPVQFSTAMTQALAGRTNQGVPTILDLVIELGPHSTLRSALGEILKTNGRDIATDYVSILHRGRAADLTTLECAGRLFTLGSFEDLATVHGSPEPSAKLLTSLPPYPFNDKTKYWLEGRESAQYRFRNFAHHEFLGTRVDDWNECEARWTNRISLDQSPWLKDHRVNGLTIFPAAGFMVMAIEAARQLHGNQGLPLGYRMREVNFPKAVTFSPDDRGTELQLTLRPGNTQSNTSKSGITWNQFTIFVYENNGWSECCSGTVGVEYREENENISEVDELKESLDEKIQSVVAAIDMCQTRVDSSDIYDAFERAGLSYGPSFRALQDVKWNKDGEATGAIHLQHWRSQDEYSYTDPHLLHPAALDTILQMTFPAYSIYAKNTSATTVPTGFRSAWFSAELANIPADQNALVHAKVTGRGFRNKLFSITAVLTDTQIPCFFGEMETSTIGSSKPFPNAGNKSNQNQFKVEYKPDFDLLPKRTLFLDPDPTKDPNLIHDKESLCLAAIRGALDKIPDVPKHLPVHLQEYVQWMRLKADERTHTSLESVESICQRLESLDVEARLLVRVAQNLSSILSGEIDALNLLFADDILSDFYANFHSNQQLLSRAAIEIDTLAHKYPGMRVLEIGAGTGSATAHVLDALDSRVSEYVYTDITPSFFAKARERFVSPKMTFRTLDISQNPFDQGFRDGEFDLIVAANVLHAANGIENALTQCRKLLQPHGRILLLEMTNREHLLEPFIFGLLPGLSRECSPEAAQNHSPLLTESEWGDMLLETGFSGMDTCISDAGFITKEAVSAVMISTVVSPLATLKLNVNVIFDDTSAAQLDLMQQLSGTFASRDGISFVPLPWSAVMEHNLAQSICVFLVGMDSNFLGLLQKDDLEKIKGVILTAQALIWVTFYTAAHDQSPTEGLVPGLTRTLATEFEDSRLISVTLDAQNGLQSAAGNITRVMDSFLQTHGVPEDEYVEQNGFLHIPRVTEDQAMSTRVRAMEVIVTRPWSDLENPQLTIGTVGRLNTLHFEQGLLSDKPLGPEDVLIEVKAAGISSRDLSVALGHVHDNTFGNGFAGVVLQIGPSPTHGLRVSDRVFGFTTNALAKVTRCKSFQLQKIPLGMDFCEAATYPVAYCTAYYSLVNCARIKSGEAVLIHHGAGEVGQAALQIAQLSGCEVFVTVGMAEKALFLHERYGVPRSHIFSSHTLSFGKGIRRLTKGRGVDVVINSLEGEAARESAECLAPFGRFVEVGEKDMAAATSVPQSAMGRNNIFAGVNLLEIGQNVIIGDVLGEVVQLIESKRLKLSKPQHVFKQSEIESAFRLMQNEGHIGKIAIQMMSDEVVQMVLAPDSKPLFHGKFSYLLAGGFGGIGQSIARWMVQQGVKNLILPTRSAVEGTGSAREKFVQELRAQGANVKAPFCDITSKTQLEQALKQLQDMPPIKGCIQAAMVVKDSSFAKMSIDDWHASLAPKLDGSWNLHCLLPSDLDFFIMFSSSTGIMGSFGQSNYTAGNTYQDALAAHRVKHGQPAVSIAFSMVTGVGWVAENSQVQALLRVRGMLEEVTMEDIYKLLTICCGTERGDMGAQIITPLSLPADLRALGIVEPLGSTRRIYSYLHTLPSRYAVTAGGREQETKKLPSFSLQDATTLAEATEIITEAVQIQLSSLLVVSKDDIDPRKPIHKYGVDSLVAVEMRNWFAKGVGADVSTVEILDDSGISELAARVAKKSRFVKEELKA
ncbi:polyketide synthase-like protein [Pyrenochaeta sp. MPI-SDFR-AT-0127]|nr:polyketide synthase-like protein [Pyrenochaeta sp. MPI-SDFR-AT-0127]